MPRATEYRKFKAEAEAWSDEARHIPVGGDTSSSCGSSPASSRGRSSSSSAVPLRPCHVPLVAAGHESTFLMDVSASAVSAGVRPGFIIPRVPVSRRVGQKDIPSLLSLQVKPPSGELGRGHGSSQGASSEAPPHQSKGDDYGKGGWDLVHSFNHLPVS